MNIDTPYNPIELAKKYGTPLYIYDGNKIKEQYEKLVQAFNYEHLKICYACKALTNISVLKFLKHLGSGLDTVSIEEIKMGLKAGFKAEDVIYTPNMVSFAEVEEAIALGVKLNVDNIELLEFIAHKYPNLPVCIRINPHISAGGHKNISVGHIDSKFGISIHQMPLIERLVQTLSINIEGVHMHTGSDIYDSDVFIFASEILFDVARKFSSTLKYIDFGSGFKVKYKESDMETDVFELGKKLIERTNQFCDEIGKKITIMFEPGKFLVSECGSFLVNVNSIKQTTSTIFVGINSGFNHLIRPMFYDAYHDIFNVSNPDGRPKVYTVVGYICETDTFGWNRKINEVRQGDILLFKNAGAYCFSMSSNYNSRCKPAEVFVLDGKDYLIREHEKVEDQLLRQTDPTINFN